MIDVLFVFNHEPSDAWSDATQAQNPRCIPRAVLIICSASADNSFTRLSAIDKGQDEHNDGFESVLHHSYGYF